MVVVVVDVVVVDVVVVVATPQLVLERVQDFDVSFHVQEQVPTHGIPVVVVVFTTPGVVVELVAETLEPPINIPLCGSHQACILSPTSRMVSNTPVSTQYGPSSSFATHSSSSGS